MYTEPLPGSKALEELEKKLDRLKPIKKRTHRRRKLCRKHKHYKALRKPRTDCKVCWRAYRKARALKEELDNRPMLDESNPYPERKL